MGTERERERALAFSFSVSIFSIFLVHKIRLGMHDSFLSFPGSFFSFLVRI